LLALPAAFNPLRILRVKSSPLSHEIKNEKDNEEVKSMSLGSKISRIRATLLPSGRKPSGIELKNRILVGTHHKTGNVWLLNIFGKICDEFGLTLYKGMAATLPKEFHVFFRGNSHLEPAQIRAPFKGLHMIRDPRDIIVSGCFYHQKSKEEWLHIKERRYGGLSYQEKINSYQSLDDQILFEMEQAGRYCIEEILAWNYSDPAFYELKYEDLICDEQLVLFHSVFTFLGFPGKAIPRLLQIAFENSLFSGALKSTPHIRSGKIKQWKQYFRSHHKARFLKLFGDALQRLGYESSDEWADAQSSDNVQEFRRVA
jgi:hypothetical protein